MFLLALFYLAAACFFGFSLLSALRLTDDAILTAAAGSVLGLSSLIFITFVLSLLLPLSPLLVFLVALAAFAAPLANIFAAARLHRSARARHIYRLVFRRSSLSLALVLTLVFALISPKILSFTPEGLSTKIPNNYGDVAWHAALITGFANGGSAITNPIFAGQTIIYPFLSDFGNAILVQSGASLSASMSLLTFILCTAGFLTFYGLVLALTRSKRAALIALLLFLFAGGTFGWTRLPGDWQKSSLPALEFLQHLPRHFYSGAVPDSDGYHFLSPLIGLILTQRSILFGWPIAVLSLWLVIRALKEPRQNKFIPLAAARLLLAGLLAGILPLFHAHTALALSVVVAGLFLFYRRREWLLFFLAGAIIGLPQIAFLFGGSLATRSLSWHPGWMTPAGTPFLIYWFKNSGFLIPLTLLALFWPLPRPLKIMAGAGLAIFTVANLWLFAPWEWDNTKLFIYWLLFTLPLVGCAAIHLWQRLPVWGRGLLAAGIAIQIFSGVLDVSQLLLPQPALAVWNYDQVALAQKVRELTSPADIFVTATNHNSGLELAGRPRYLGYTGHAWSHGLDYFPREQALSAFYQDRLSVLPGPSPRFILVGPAERAQYPNLQIRPSWQLIIQQGPYAIYKLQAPKYK